MKSQRRQILTSFLTPKIDVTKTSKMKSQRRQILTSFLTPKIDLKIDVTKTSKMKSKNSHSLTSFLEGKIDAELTSNDVKKVVTEVVTKTSFSEGFSSLQFYRTARSRTHSVRSLTSILGRHLMSVFDFPKLTSKLTSFLTSMTSLFELPLRQFSGAHFRGPRLTSNDFIFDLIFDVSSTSVLEVKNEVSF